MLVDVGTVSCVVIGLNTTGPGASTGDSAGLIGDSGA